MSEPTMPLTAERRISEWLASQPRTVANPNRTRLARPNHRSTVTN
jgi:hypothetical protein